jgi:hypothetical protein
MTYTPLLCVRAQRFCFLSEKNKRSGLQKISARPTERGVIHMIVEMRKFSASLIKSLEAMSGSVSREMNDFALRDGGHDTQRFVYKFVAGLGQV